MWRWARSCKMTWIPRATEVCRLRKYRRRGATRFLRPYNHNNNNNNSHNIVIIYVYCILHAIRVHRAHNNEYYNNNNMVSLVYYYYYKIEQSAVVVVVVVFWRNYYIPSRSGALEHFWRWPFSQECFWRVVVLLCSTAQCLEHATSTSSQITFSRHNIAELFMRSGAVVWYVGWSVAICGAVEDNDN